MKYNIMLMGACMLLQIGQVVGAGRDDLTEYETARPVYYIPLPCIPYPIWAGYEPWAWHALLVMPASNYISEDELSEYEYPDNDDAISGNRVYAEDTGDEEELDAEIEAGPAVTPINYSIFLDFRKMTYYSPTSWASIP